jgi:plasmid stabilization system protein ParE
MKRAILKWDRVEQDLTYYYAFIAVDKVKPADKLLEVAEKSFERLAAHPSIGIPWKSTRRKLQNLFYYPMPAPYRSYLIFYIVAPDRIEIVAVIQGSRDLENRLRDVVE